jgi:hypothetical protein
MSLYSRIERPPIIKKSTLSKMIANIFNRNKGAKIGIIDENANNNNNNNNNNDDGYETGIRTASPIDIVVELDKKSKPKNNSKTKSKTLKKNKNKK